MSRTKLFTQQALKLLLVSLALTLMLEGSSSAQSAAVRRVGILTPGANFDPVFRGLKEGLVRGGYVEDKNIAFIVEDTKGSSSNLLPRAKGLLRNKPELIVAITTEHALAAKQATATVPVVFAAVRDPVAAGLVASFSSSGNNLTGIVTAIEELVGKRLEILLEVAPKVKRVLTIVTPQESVAVASFGFLEETASKLHVQLMRRDAATEDELKKVVLQVRKESVDAIFLIPSVLVMSCVELLIEKAKVDRIPIMATEDSLTSKGALVSYGVNFTSVGAQAGRLVAKVLKGEKPSAIPSEIARDLTLAINLKTAKEIGVRVPPAVLERAAVLIK